MFFPTKDLSQLEFLSEKNILKAACKSDSIDSMVEKQIPRRV